MFVLVDDAGPVLLRASWKIPSGETVADNFWRSGNMLAGIDVETGKIIRVLRRTAHRAPNLPTSIRKRAPASRGSCFRSGTRCATS